VYRIHSRFNLAVPRDGDGADGSELKLATEDAEISHRALAQPAHVEVSVAVVEGKPDVDNADPPAVADVGSPELAPVVAPAVGKGGTSQSDGEVVDARPEPVHSVAPVPMQEEGLAALAAPIASLGAASTPAKVKASQPLVSANVNLSVSIAGAASNSGSPTPGQKSSLPMARLIPAGLNHVGVGAPILPKLPAIAVLQSLHPKSQTLLAFIYYGRTRLALTPIGDLRNLIKVASPQESVFVAVGILGDSSDRVKVAIAPGWPLVDETPILDPSLMIESLSSNDSLQLVAQHWLPRSKTSSAAYAIPN
jgi:hypothetical protein